ncbi:MAG: DUF3048 domain-containing protein [Oscillospiraceae bacterium]|nr:DUF3048 domain-containing protein [Oscillospiraceae bacterium]
MKRILAMLLAVLTFAGVFTGCVSAPGGDESDQPEIVEPTPPPYTPNPWTGWEKAADFDDNMRATAIMINNISVARPQKGLSQANILFESKVEGGITRFMAIFEDYTKIDGDVGPVRSGRDQFLQWAMPYHALYCHIGRSGITQTYIDSFEYNYLDVDGQYRIFTERRNRPGYDTEHTSYTNAELLQAVIDKYEYDMNKTYGSPVFDFVDYRENNGTRELSGQLVTDISVVHSEVYRTYFTYDEAANRYMMSQYNGSKRTRENTVDESNGQQLGFENVIIAFADISKYPWPGDGPYDPNYQKVDLSYGGVGYYFSNGRMEQIRWFKGGAPDVLRFTDMDENPLKINCGKSYIGFVDYDEAERFEFVGPEEEIAEETIDNTQEVTTDTEFE